MSAMSDPPLDPADATAALNALLTVAIALIEDSHPLLVTALPSATAARLERIGLIERLGQDLAACAQAAAAIARRGG